MRRTPIPCRGLVVASASAAWLALFSRFGSADELGIGGSAGHLTIHGPLETMRDFCSRDGEGRLWLTLPGGARFELVTSTADPAIANPGDGSFHPFDEAEVRSALEAVRYPLERVEADVFLLPYPRRAGLESAAGPELILLAPGVWPVSPAQQHAELTHELGHVVQYAFMPDRDVARWAAYRALRRIEDASVYSATGAHADRPHEIFAEDFRALFGDALATWSGTIENSSLAAPSQVTGLEALMRQLSGTTAIQPSLAAFPNPARGVVRFSTAEARTLPLELYDAAGRRIASLVARATPAGTEWIWDPTEPGSRRHAHGVVFARSREDRGPALRVTLLK